MKKSEIIQKIKNITNPDSELSITSTNTLQNKVITENLKTKENTSNKVTTINGTSTDVQYPTAKSVYTELQNIKDFNIDKKILVDWELGTFSSIPGTPTTSLTRVRTKDFLPYRKSIVQFNTGYKAGYYLYDKNYNRVETPKGLVSNPFTIMSSNENVVYMKFYAACADDSTITDIDEFLLNCNLIIKCNSDTTSCMNYTDNQISKINNGFATIPFTDVSLFEKVGIIGDSWCSGFVYPNDVETNDYPISWGQIMGRKHGISVTNFSRGGLRCDTWLQDTKGLSLLNSEDAKNLYIIALGINDATAIDDETLTIGTINDIDVNSSDNNANSFYGYYGKIISAIQNKVPKSKIILTTIARQDKSTYNTLNTAILEISNLFGIAYIKTSDDALFNSDYFKTLTKVHAHPTAPAYSGMAEAYSRLIAKCMEEQYTYFIDYYGDI